MDVYQNLQQRTKRWRNTERCGRRGGRSSSGTVWTHINNNNSIVPNEIKDLPIKVVKRKLYELLKFKVYCGIMYCFQ